MSQQRFNWIKNGYVERQSIDNVLLITPFGYFWKHKRVKEEMTPDWMPLKSLKYDFLDENFSFGENPDGLICGPVEVSSGFIEEPKIGGIVFVPSVKVEKGFIGEPQIEDQDCVPVDEVDFWFQKIDKMIDEVVESEGYEGYLRPKRKLSEIFGNSFDFSEVALVGGTRTGMSGRRPGRFVRNGRSRPFIRRGMRGGRGRYRIRGRIKNSIGVRKKRTGARLENGMGPVVAPEMQLSKLYNTGEFLPDVYYARLKYFENDFDLSLGSSDSMLAISFALNDPYDPYINVGGKSAQGFYQLMSNYRYCRVSKAKVTVEYVDIASANTCPIQTVLIYDSESSGYTDFDSVVSQPGNKRVVNTKMNNRIGTPQRISGIFLPSVSFGFDKIMWNALPVGSDYDVTNNGGIASPNVLSLVTLYYGRIAANTLGTAIGCRGTVTIEYYCQFRNRIAFSEPQEPEIKRDKITLSEKVYASNRPGG